MAASGFGQSELGLCLAHSLLALAHSRDDYRSGYVDGHAGDLPLRLSDAYVTGHTDGRIASGRARPGGSASSWPHLWEVWTGLAADGPHYKAFAAMMAGLAIEEAFEFAANARRWRESP
jgi:hypothetical protein